MPKVKNLSKTFYDDLKAITTCLQEGLLPLDYEHFYKLVRRKQLAKATRFLEHLYDEYTEVNVFELEKIRKLEGKKTMHHYVAFRIEMRRWLGSVLDEWLRLMIQNGGSKKAGRLAQASRQKLPVTKPWMYAHRKQTVKQEA